MPWLIWLAAMLEGISLTLIQGFLPLYVRRALGETHFLTVGAVVAIPALGTIAASNFWGGLSDVSGRLKPFVLIGVLGYAAALAGVSPLRQAGHVLALVGAASLLYGTLAPTLKTYVTLASPARREHALAYLLMAQAVGWLLGSWAWSALFEGAVDRRLSRALLLAAALLFVYAALAGLRLADLRRPPLPARATRGWLGGLLEDLVSLYENPRLLRLCLVGFFAIAGNYVAWGFFSVYLTERLHASIHMLGYSFAASAAAGIAMYFGVGPIVRRFGGGRVLAVVATGYVGMYLGMGLARNPLAVAILFVVPLYGFLNVSLNVLAAEYSREEQRGGGLGVLNGVLALGTVGGPLAAGFLADRSGLGAVPWCALGCLLPAAAIAWWSLARSTPAHRSEEKPIAAG
ncbi:MAG TPA: MFS transporter [Candidatus Eisenbacteria bacterium]|jgi:predicted MFS family arabinose efflux permease